MKLSLVEFLTNLTYEDLSHNAVVNVKKCIFDTMIVGLAGSKEVSSQMIASIEEKDPEGMNLWTFGEEKRSYRYAAAINGAFAHALDFDDLHNKSIVHPAVLTVPPALSVGKKYHKSGKEIITAIAAGYEIGTRLGEAVNPRSYRFWHTTGLVGTLAAAVVTAKLLHLDLQQMENAIGSAGTQAGGLWEFMKNGSMSKLLHVFHGVFNGIVSAELAKKGFTGAATILEGNQGLIKAVTNDFTEISLQENLGQPFKVEEVALKAYACCRHIHSSLTAIENIRERFDFSVDEIEKIHISTYQIALNVTDNLFPKTAHAHKFSIQYCVAAMIVFGKVNESVFQEKCFLNSTVKDLMKKVTLKMDDIMNHSYNSYREKWTHRVDILLKGGKIVSETVDYPLGDQRNPLDEEGLIEKAMGLVSPELSREDVESLYKSIFQLENQEIFSGLEWERK